MAALLAPRSRLLPALVDLLLLLLLCRGSAAAAAAGRRGAAAFLVVVRQELPPARAAPVRRRPLLGALGAASANANDGVGGGEGGDGWPMSGLRARLERQTRAELVEAVVGSPSRLSEVRLVGQAFVPAGGGGGNGNEKEQAPRTVPCVVLSSVEDRPSSPPGDPTPCLLVPLGSGGSPSSSAAFGRGSASARGGIRLLEFVARERVLSKSVLLRLNSLVANRDGALFDNLPWAPWTVDPRLRARDAAGNPAPAKLHLGKRDAYHRMMGKDWRGKSLAIGNLARRLQRAVERQEEEEDDAAGGEPRPRKHQQQDGDDSAAASSLAARILRLQIKEQEMAVADLDYELAVGRQRLLRESGGSDVPPAGDREDLDRLSKDREDAGRVLRGMRDKLDRLLNPAAAGSADPRDGDGPSSVIAQVLRDAAAWSADGGRNEAPYRGATGYAPRLDTLQDVRDGLSGMYRSPYDLLKEIIADQLNADVIGAVLENASLLEGTLSVGGAVILRRRTPLRSVTIAGERLTVGDEDEDLGNDGVTGGRTVLVECDVDEAIGLAMACGAPVQVESDVRERGSVMMVPLESAPLEDPKKAPAVRGTLPVWRTRDPLLSFIVEGQATNQSSTGRAAPLRIPRTTSSLLDAFFEPRTPGSSSKAMFPTDNPIQSLEDYDRLSSEDKARTLMSMSNFDGRLPRRRAVRQSPAILDELLLPLVDESTRRQYRIREAMQRGDADAVRELEQRKSDRQIAKEKAELARSLGEDAEAEKWEREADLYTSLRADVTQDEGSYSRFL
jgi:hypothetical protein